MVKSLRRTGMATADRAASRSASCALEKFLVGQDAQRCRAARLVELRDGSRVKVIGKNAFARGRLFDLGDDRRRRRNKGGTEIARGRTVGRTALQIGAIGRMRARTGSACDRQF